MEPKNLYPVAERGPHTTHSSPEDYQRLYDSSITDPDAFWGEHGKRLDWMTTLYHREVGGLRQRFGNGRANQVVRGRRSEPVRQRH